MAKKKQSETKQTFTPSGTTIAADTHWDTITLSTRIPSLDHILGGGFGCRRLAELFGIVGSGKSAVGYRLLISAEKLGGTGILIDSEGAFSRDFYKLLGGDPDKLHVANEFETDTVEKVFEFIKCNVQQYGEYGLDAPPLVILWDSIAATATQHLQETDLGTRDLSKSSSMSAGLQKVTPYVRTANVCVICINQLYTTFSKYGSSTDTSGGMKTKYMASQRVYMGYGNSDRIFDDENNHIGHKVLARVDKNRMGSPHKKANLYFYTVDGAKHPVYDRVTTFGFDLDQSLFDYYVNGTLYIGTDRQRVIRKNGAWYNLHPSIDPSEKSFHAKDWPEQLDKFPQLKDLIYHDLEIPTV